MADRPTFQFLERTSGLVTAVIVGNDGVTAIPGSTLTGLLLTLYAVRGNGTEEILNGRNQQNVLNANNATVDETGLFSWVVQPADTTIVETILRFERHLALLEWTWANGSGKEEFIINVENLRRVS